MEKVDHLVLSGGAIKGISFLGALECLQRRQSLELTRLKVLVGSSAGAFIVSLISIGYTTAQLFKEVVDTDFATLARPEIGKVMSHFGLDSGHGLVDKLKELFRRKGVNPNITFKQHYEYTKKHLAVTVSCLGKGVFYFDYTNQPDLAVITAVRMSVGIPGYFTAVRYQGNYYVDGGMLDNVPIAFLRNVAPERVVVIRTSTISPTPDIETPIATEEDTLEDYLWLLWLTNAREMERLRLESKQTIRDIHRRSTIPITITPVSSPIAPTLEDKKTLLRDGYRAALDYLESDVWLELRISGLPFRAMRKIWQDVHRRTFTAALQEIKSSTD
jgi:predicted acylesterase/phospholipase RssA